VLTGVSTSLKGELFVKDEPNRPAIRKRLRRSGRNRPVAAPVESLAHDFNNVLSTICGYAQLARAAVEPDSRAYEHLTEVLKACDRGAEMTARWTAYRRSA
jgi:nitrogen-specific signal transduction histidine kinase